MISTEPAIAGASASFNLLRGMTAASDMDGLPGQREIQVERRPLAGATLHANLARVFLDDAVGDGKPEHEDEALAFLRGSLGREEWIVIADNLLGRDYDSRVESRHRHAIAVR